MTRNCVQCGRFFAPAHYYPKQRFCTERCRRIAGKQRTPGPGFDMPEGSLVKLSDVPQHVRFAAFRSLVDSGQLSEDEIPLAFAAALEPGELSTRVAA